MPIADEFRAGIGGGGEFLDLAIFRAGEPVGRDASEIGGARFESFFEGLAKFVAAADSTRAYAGRSGLRSLRGRVVLEIG